MRATSGHPDGVVHRLRRGAWARLRVPGILEFASWAGIVLVPIVVADVADDGSAFTDGFLQNALLAAFLVGSVAVRLAVATEYVEADHEGIRWRSLFRTSFVPWEEVERVQGSLLWLLGWRTMGTSVLEIVATDGTARTFRPTAFCGDAMYDWLAAVEARTGG